MRKSEESPRFRRPELDLLEGRLLLTFGAHPSSVHAIAPTSVQVGPSTTARTDAEVDSGRNEPTTPEADPREVETIAASSVDPRSNYTIPLVAAGKLAAQSDNPPATIQDSSRYLWQANPDEPIAWTTEPGASVVVPRSRHRGDATQPSLEFGGEPILDGIAKPGARPAKVERLPEPHGSDLLANFLLADGATLEQAIEGLLHGLGETVVGHAGYVEAGALIPSPILWGIAISSLEIARRRLRRLALGDDDDDHDRDPAVGILGTSTTD